MYIFFLITIHKICFISIFKGIILGGGTLPLICYRGTFWQLWCLFLSIMCLGVIFSISFFG